MGAHNISIERSGKLSKSEILKVFNDQKLEDSHVNGHQYGYSGDFQTIHEVKFDVLYDGIGNYNKDYELALNKAEKWNHAQAIYTKTKDGKDFTLIVGWGAE